VKKNHDSKLTKNLLTCDFLNFLLLPFAFCLFPRQDFNPCPPAGGRFFHAAGGTPAFFPGLQFRLAPKGTAAYKARLSPGILELVDEFFAAHFSCEDYTIFISFAAIHDLLEKRKEGLTLSPLPPYIVTLENNNCKIYVSKTPAGQSGNSLQGHSKNLRASVSKPLMPPKK
jgi:hypothetical protein